MNLTDKLIFGFGITLFLIGVSVFVKLSFTFLLTDAYKLSDLTPYAILLSALVASIAMYMSTRVNILLDRKSKQRDAKTKQFEFMMNLYNFYYTHEGIRTVRFAIEYDNFIYEDTDKGGDKEKYLFALLRYFENVCTMYYNEVLTMNEIEPILYDMKKVSLNSEVQKFISEILNRHEEYKTKPPYSNYLKFCKESF